MRTLHLTALAVLSLLALAAPPATAAQQDRAATRGTQAERSEIARILAADNLDAENHTPTQIATTIRAIPRGAAPADFWTAYQAHVQAWSRFAELFEQANNMRPEDSKQLTRLIAEAEAAEQAIGTTFDEVERVATAYGVDMPTPPAAANALPTT